MRHTILILGLVIACAHAPVKNEAVGKTGRHVEFTAPIQAATFCASCGRGAPVTIQFGAPARVTLVIPSCYPHAQSKVGDHDNVQITLAAGTGPVAATAGELDIDDCTTKHLVGKLWATFPDGLEVRAVIDSDLSEPAK